MPTLLLLRFFKPTLLIVVMGYGFGLLLDANPLFAEGVPTNPDQGIWMEGPSNEELLKNSGNGDDAPTFQAGVRQDRILPPAFYGRWNIVATTLETTAPEGLFLAKSSEIWELSQSQHVVTVENVINRANASVSIDEVKGSTATFHHTAGNETTRILEIPTVTVSGDRLFGVNMQTLQYLRNNKVVKEFKFRKQVEGYRLASEGFRFKPALGSGDGGKPDFEVAPLEPEQPEEELF